MLVLLYADQNGDLRVVLTIRAKTLSSCKFLSLLCSASSYHVGIGCNNAMSIIALSIWIAGAIREVISSHRR